jgi:hypothetical protein
VFLPERFAEALEAGCLPLVGACDRDDGAASSQQSSSVGGYYAAFAAYAHGAFGAPLLLPSPPPPAHPSSATAEGANDGAVGAGGAGGASSCGGDVHLWEALQRPGQRQGPSTSTGGDQVVADGNYGAACLAQALLGAAVRGNGSGAGDWAAVGAAAAGAVAAEGRAAIAAAACCASSADSDRSSGGYLCEGGKGEVLRGAQGALWVWWEGTKAAMAAEVGRRLESACGFS